MAEPFRFPFGFGEFAGQPKSGLEPSKEAAPRKRELPAKVVPHYRRSV